TSGISRTPTPIEPQIRRTYSTVGTIAQMSTGSLNSTQAIPLPAQSLPHSSGPATPSKVTTTATTAQISNPASLPVIHENRMPTRVGYDSRLGFRRSPAQMAAQQVIGTLGVTAIIGGIITVFVFTIRKKD
ncbi:hypothetical protein, partial [Pseudomonas sp. NBRC 111124]|uniref:hypothetical protein n=1 Tax=Pseudomonas sp. NBRC 111124 TaxID=1661039 RepID=UPI001C44A283